MITNQDVYSIWSELSDPERVKIITKFKMEGLTNQDIIQRKDIREYLLSNYILRKKVVVK